MSKELEARVAEIAERVKSAHQFATKLYDLDAHNTPLSANGAIMDAANLIDGLAAELSRLTATLAARKGYVLVPVEKLERWREGVLGHGAHWNYARLLEVADEIRLMLAARPTPADSGEG